MKNITELRREITETEKKFKGIRTKRHYQDMYQMVADMIEEAEYLNAHGGDTDDAYDYKKMLVICHYCNVRHVEVTKDGGVSFEELNEENAKTVFFEVVENHLKKPYILEAVISPDGIVDDDRDVLTLGTFESFEECFKTAEEIWKNREEYPVYSECRIEDCQIQRLTMESQFPYYQAYCVFDNLSINIGEIADIMAIEKAIFGKCNRKWLFALMDYAAKMTDNYADTVFEKMPREFKEELLKLTEKTLSTRIPR